MIIVQTQLEITLMVTNVMSIWTQIPVKEGRAPPPAGLLRTAGHAPPSLRWQCPATWNHRICFSALRKWPVPLPTRAGHYVSFRWSLFPTVCTVSDTSTASRFSLRRAEVNHWRDRQKRTSQNTQDFMLDVRRRIADHPIQSTTDAHIFYRKAVEESFAGDADFAQLTKL